MSVRVTRRRVALALVLASAALVGAPADAAPGTGSARQATTIVFCAPGSPGTTEEAQGAMNAFASAVAERAGLRDRTLAATYASAEAAGVARIRQGDAGVALVSLPFFLAHQKELKLEPAGLQAVMAQPGGAPGATAASGVERWSLVAARGRVTGPAALDGFTIVSAAGYAPAFVRAALAGYGALPASARIAPSAAVLSALRRAAGGEQVAVLLDGAQSAALAGLAFAKDLEVVARSDPFPVGVVATVDRRLPAPAWRSLQRALLTLHESPAGAGALAGIRVARFEPLDEAAFSRARKAFAEAAR